MALTFSYKLVQASDLETASAGTKKGKGNNLKTASQGKGNKGGKKGVQLDDANAGTYGVLEGTASQSIEIYGNGTDLDQARTYWLEIYASDADASDVTLESLDLSLNFSTDAFSAVNNFQYADAFDLMRQSAQSGNDLRFQQGSADNLKTSGNGKGGGNTDPYETVGTGIALSSAESFVGRVEVEVNDSFFHGIADTAGDTRTSAGVIGDYINLDINIDETVLVTEGVTKNSIQTLREYGGNNGDEYNVIDGVNDGSSAGLQSAPSIQFVTGDFASDVSAAFDGFRTAVTTTTGESTNLVREGQFLDGGSFQVSNVGQAGLTDINMTWGGNETGIDINFLNATVDSAFDDDKDATHDIADNGDGTYTFGTGTNAQLERGERDDNSGGVTDNSDTLTVDYNATVTGAAGTVAKVDFTDLRITSSGEAAFDVFQGNSAVIKNVITYQGDVSYDGKVSMFDLAVLNEAKSQLDNGATGDYRHANADHTGGIDIEDLKVLADDWGKSLYQTDTAWQAQIATGEWDLQNGGDATEQSFASDAFNNEGSLAPSQLQMALPVEGGNAIVAADEAAYA